MSFACVFMVLLLGSSVVVAFVLQPSHEESDGSRASAGAHQSCRDVPLHVTKKHLLKALNLQTEPQVPVGLLDSVHEQWRLAFSALSQQTQGSEEAHAASVSDDGSRNSLKCCSMTSEVFMKDLGWDNWVIFPLSLTLTHCRLCSGAGGSVQCPHAHPYNGQVPCCHPTSLKTVPIVYIDESGSVTMSSVQLTQSCGCGSDQNIHK